MLLRYFNFLLTATVSSCKKESKFSWVVSCMAIRNLVSFVIAFALSLPSTSHTICIGNNFHHVNPYIEIATAICDIVHRCDCLIQLSIVHSC